MLYCEERSAAFTSNLGDAALVGVLAGGLRLNRGTTWGRNLFANSASSQALLASLSKISHHRSTPSVSMLAFRRNTQTRFPGSIILARC
jgi:hypothetical protein